MRSADRRWFDLIEAAHESVPTASAEWPTDPPDATPYQLAALYRMETTIHGSGFLHFYGLWGERTYQAALDGLERMGAETCKALLIEQRGLVERVLGLPDFESGDDFFRLLKPEEMAAIEARNQALWDLPDDTVELGLATFDTHGP